MAKATYYAITTTNPADGWSVKAWGVDKEKVREAAEKLIGDVATEYGTDIYRVTEQRNLQVVSKTTAEKWYGFDLTEPEQRFYHLEGVKEVR